MVGWPLRSAIFILFPPPSRRPLSLKCSKYTLPFPIPHVLLTSLRHLSVFKCLQVTLVVLKPKLFLKSNAVATCVTKNSTNISIFRKAVLSCPRPVSGQVREYFCGICFSFKIYL